MHRYFLIIRKKIKKTAQPLKRSEAQSIAQNTTGLKAYLEHATAYQHNGNISKIIGEVFYQREKVDFYKNDFAISFASRALWY